MAKPNTNLDLNGRTWVWAFGRLFDNAWALLHCVYHLSQRSSTLDISTTYLQAFIRKSCTYLYLLPLLDTTQGLSLHSGGEFCVVVGSFHTSHESRACAFGLIHHHSHVTIALALPRLLQLVHYSLYLSTVRPGLSFGHSLLFFPNFNTTRRCFLGSALPCDAMTSLARERVEMHFFDYASREWKWFVLT